MAISTTAHAGYQAVFAKERLPLPAGKLGTVVGVDRRIQLCDLRRQSNNARRSILYSKSVPRTRGDEPYRRMLRAAYTAAPIAGASLLMTGFMSVRLGMAKFIFPFAFFPTLLIVEEFRMQPFLWIVMHSSSAIWLFSSAHAALDRRKISRKSPWALSRPLRCWFLRLGSIFRRWRRAPPGSCEMVGRRGPRIRIEKSRRDIAPLAQPDDRPTDRPAGQDRIGKTRCIRPGQRYLHFPGGATSPAETANGSQLAS